MSDTVEVIGIVEQRKALEQLLTSNPQMEKKIQRIIRRVFAEAKKQMQDAAASEMSSDPRQTHRAVKTAVYRRILGGNMSILDSRGTKTRPYDPPKKLRAGQRGGNRVPRGTRTQQVMDYYGESRAFVLRFLNAGAGTENKREAGKRGGKLHGNRGTITARNFFGSNSLRIMQQTAGKLDALIDQAIANEMN